MSKILYIEDNDDNIFVLSRRLTRAGFDLVVARDGQEGICVAEEEMPDLILMDLSLPVLDGWTAAGRLKTSAGTRNIPIVALSAHAMPGDRERALEAGCDDYAVKPVDFAELLATIENLLPKPVNRVQ
jgi:two-component system cell cycle response regulator DivK